MSEDEFKGWMDGYEARKKLTPLILGAGFLYGVALMLFVYCAVVIITR